MLGERGVSFRVICCNSHFKSRGRHDCGATVRHSVKLPARQCVKLVRNC